MVTVDAAAAIGMGGQLGSLIPGYLADLILVNIAGLNMAPTYSLLDNLIYCCNGRDVETVIVNGKIVVQGGRLLTVDETHLVAEVEKTGKSLIQKAVQKHADLAWLWQDNL